MHRKALLQGTAQGFFILILKTLLIRATRFSNFTTAVVAPFWAFIKGGLSLDQLEGINFIFISFYHYLYTIYLSVLKLPTDIQYYKV